jgi:hypothetical protein
LTFASGWIEMDDHPGRRHGCRMRRHRLRPAPGCGRRRTRPQHDKWHRRCEAMVPHREGLPTCTLQRRSRHSQVASQPRARNLASAAE